MRGNEWQDSPTAAGSREVDQRVAHDLGLSRDTVNRALRFEGESCEEVVRLIGAAGYSAAEESPIFLAIFGAPALVAGLL